MGFKASLLFLLLTAITPLSGFSKTIKTHYKDWCLISNIAREDGESVFRKNIMLASSKIHSYIDKNGMCGDINITTTLPPVNVLDRSGNDFEIKVEAFYCDNIDSIRIDHIDCRDGFTPINDLGKRDIDLIITKSGKRKKINLKY